jgi:PAS domain S-box-containing protein
MTTEPHDDGLEQRALRDGLEQRALRDALDVLAAVPAVRDDPHAAHALAEVATGLQRPASLQSEQFARAARIVGSSLDFNEVLQNALGLAIEAMHAERGLLLLAESDVPAALKEQSTGEPGLAEDSSARQIAERVLRSGEPLFTTDAQADPNWTAAQSSIVSLHVRAVACVPLRLRERVLGAIYVDSRVIPGVFKHGDRELLIAIAHQAALAAENARLFGEERERASRLSELQGFQARLLEAIANGVVTLSPRRSITSFNRAAEVTFGVAATAMVGREAEAIMQFLPELGEMLDLFFDNGAVLLRAEVEGRRRDGARLIAEIRLTPLETAEGVGVALVVTDVTRQRRLEEENEAERARAEAIQKSFSRYLAPHVVQSLVNDPGSVRLGGERRHATMLFADIRGFTSLAATLPPERVVEILNTYFEVAVRIVFEFEGLLDKFYGDGMMAVFGAPRARGDDARRAVQAALALHDAVRDEIGPRLDYPIAVSIGLASGDVVAGHFGSQLRMDYTVIGDAVNLAQGLQHAAPPGAIYLDEETYRLASPTPRPFHRLGARVKGRADLVAVHALFPEGTL